MDISLSCDLINNNVGHRVFMKIQKYGSNDIKKIMGVIKSAFSNDSTPDCRIDTASGIEEVLLGEIVEIELLS
ncbi:MAG TPA: hypothetical protein PKC87_01450 [Candidatus Absconditabacterales bacterium]|nr:hypothetical protein [Candidatus Absconditabacterales bacterium]